MNCKPGDLAVVVRAEQGKAHRIGVIVTVVEPYRGKGKGDWVVEYAGDWWRSNDCNLRPIRDNNGEDETLTWKTVPKVETRKHEGARQLVRIKQRG